MITALRNFIRQKGFSFINILGLSTGIACSILIFLWVSSEIGYNRFNSKSDRLYRLVQTQQYTTGPLTTPCMPGPIAEDIREEIPEILNTFMYYWMGGIIRYDDKVFEERILLSDPQIFEMIDFEYLAGDPSHYFDDFNSVVLSDEMARKYFGEEDPLGKVLSLNNEYQFKVSGVVKKHPANSSFRFGLCIPFEHVEKMGYTIDRYGWNTYYVYAELHENADYREVNEKIKDFISIKNEVPLEESTVTLFLFPFEKVHLFSFDGKGGDIQYVYIFSVVGLLILIIACINYMNLSTARSSRRSREIGIRKTIGATRSQVMGQFFGESLLMTVIGFLLALVIVYFVLPSFNAFIDAELHFSIQDPVNLLALIAILVFVGFLAGSYPALFLSRFRPAGVLKGKALRGKGGKIFRRALVVFQFSLSIILIICTMIIFRQMNYMQDTDTGFDREHVVFMEMNGSINSNYKPMKTDLLQNTNILSVTRGNSLPFWMGSNSGGIAWEGKNPDDDVLVGFTFVDYNYLETMGLELKEGRFYDAQFSTDTVKIVINEKFAGIISDREVLGKWVSWGPDNRYEVIGVVKDFHHLPMEYEISPMIMVLNPDHGNYLYARINMQNRDAAIEQMEATWKKFNPDFPVEVKFLDVEYNNTFRNEKKMGSIFRLFTLLAILISCLGLFGLAAYMAEQRTREISVRKVFGANTSLLMYLMTRDFLRWVLIANIIAWPVAWYAMKNWLENYVYHTEISVWYFILAAVLSILISLVTVSLHALRTASRNPAETLRYE